VSAACTHIVLLNGHARAVSYDLAESIRARFDAHGVKSDIRIIGKRDQIDEAVARAVAAQPRVLVAAGGDGTISTVASALLGSEVLLGVLPLGTLNHFAKDLQIPLEVGPAVDTICTGRAKAVDVGWVNGRVFVNNSSLGLYPQVVRRRDELVHRLGRPKWPAFAWAALTVLRRYPFMDVRLTVEGRSATYRSPVVFVGNNQYVYNGLRLGERRRLDEGCLSVHVVRRVGRLGLALLALRALLGGLRDAADFETFCAPELEVITRRKSVSVATDGEVSRMNSPLSYRIRAASLSVIVPSEQVAAADA